MNTVALRHFTSARRDALAASIAAMADAKRRNDEAARATTMQYAPRPPLMQPPRQRPECKAPC